jgi:hypothetical protein
VNTIGIIEVAALAARAEASLPVAAITATLRPIRSAAIAGSRSSWPCAQQYSIATFLALDITGLVHPLEKRGHQVRVLVRRLAIEEPDHRHRGLLRARRNRPRNR